MSEQMVKIVQAIQIGDNVTDIMRIPAIKQCEKVEWEGREVLLYRMQGRTGTIVPVQKSDWLVETESGEWLAYSDKVYQKLRKEGKL